MQMKRRLVLSGLLGLLFALTVGAGVASAQGNFSGKWELDKSKSSGIAPLSGASMTIVQNGQKVSISHRLDTPQGVLTPKDEFVLNGSTQEIMLDGPNGTRAKGKRTAKRIEGGFETVDEGTFKPERFPEAVTVKTTRRWTLSPDGQTLTLDISRTSKLGDQHSRRVFTKQ
jgi:hypothetical protein